MTLNRNFAIALGLAALVGGSMLQAEELRGAHVPFAFQAAGQKFEPGNYGIVRRTAGGSMLLQNTGTGQAVYVTPFPAGKTHVDKSSVTFLCYGSECFLERFQFSGTQIAYQLEPSRRERELAKVDQPTVMMLAMR